MTEAFICDAIRTPVGRYNGGLSRGPSRRSRRPSHQGADEAQHRRRLGRRRRRDLWLRQPGGRGQSQRGAHGGAAGRPAGRGGGRHGQSPVRLGPRGGRACCTRREARRGRHDDRRRRRGHDPRTLRHGQGRGSVRPLDEARGHRAGLALRQSAHEGRLRRRRRWARPPRTSPASTRSAAPTRTPSPIAASAAARRPRTAASSTARSSRSASRRARPRPSSRRTSIRAATPRWRPSPSCRRRSATAAR